MSIVQNQPTIYGTQDIYSKLKSVCTALKKQIGGNSKAITPQNSKRMQEFCRHGEFSKYVLLRITEITKTYI